MRKDSLYGNADEDLLIAGWTTYDTTDAALMALMREWCSGSCYADRVAHLQAGTGLAGGYRLSADDGTGQTVFNDSDVDVLTGSPGKDWFLANQVADGGGPVDRVTDAGSDLWADTDF